MAAIISRTRTFIPPKSGAATTEAKWVGWLMMGITFGFLGLFLLIPLIAVFFEAFKQGISLYFGTFTDRYALDAIWLTVTVALLSVPLNLVFGLAAAWVITKYSYKGKSVLVTV